MTLQTSIQKLEVWGYPGMEVELGAVPTFSDEEFIEFCRHNPDARIERESDGSVVIMAPTFTETGAMNADLSATIGFWAKRDNTGCAYGSSTGFTLSNGAIRSPDVSWVSNQRWNALSNKDRAGFARISPDFVLELRSPTDSLAKVKAKMQEYIENGSLLGWLIDPIDRKVYVYRPNADVETLTDPKTVSGEDVLKGFELELAEVWG